MATRTNAAAAVLIAPLALLVVATFVVPLAVALYTAIANPEVRETLPRTAAALATWNREGLPSEAAFAAVSAELARAQERQTIGPLARRLNFEQTGLRALLLKTARAHGSLSAPYRDALAGLDARWTDPSVWRLIQRNTSPTTALYLLRSVDLTLTPVGDIAKSPADEAIFLRLFGRTFEISLWVTVLCVLIAYPAAYTMARLPKRQAHVALTLVLVPFWTSILVRTTAWFILLQREGPVNALLLALGLVDAPIAMIFNRFAVYVAMVHVLLPFAILPLYSVMKGIDPAYLRAAASLGASPWRRFVRVYLPLSMPGVAAAALMVFMLAVGFYITPSLVGGPDDQMVSTFIAFYTNNTINWGMSAALATLLLAATAAIVVVARYALPGVTTRGLRA
ncbi:MAG: ABC transporter permease [Burkholderiales bacterium]|nr:ABC transporter permease [Burkholderiales bacterium]MCE7876820.1 ABC transporter permease [Betaproteobacteria bacterium PRO3]